MTAVRLIARFVAVLLIAIGTGFIAYGAAVDAANFHAPAGITILYGPAETLAWGVGMLIGGVLILAFFGLRAPTFDKPGKP